MPDHKTRHKELNEAVFEAGDSCSERWQGHPPVSGRAIPKRGYPVKIS